MSIDGENEATELRQAASTPGLSLCCANCHRVKPDVQVDVHVIPEYSVDLTSARISTLKKRKYSSIRHQDYSCDNDAVLLCLQCSEYLTKQQPKSKNEQWQILWPSFMWHFLTNKSQAADVLGEKMWSFVPKQWRYFWMQELKNEFPLVYASISITHPRPHFREMSYEVNDFNGILKRGLLGEIKHGCNQYLNAVVLCPWGCCEFPHKAGNIQLDVVLQRYIQFSAVSLHSDKAVLLKVRNARNDFIGGERDCLLMNPEWEISPTIAYIEGIGPRVLTCCDHNGGCTKRYFHSPRTGITIPAPGGDQLSHAVVQPRTVKKSVAKTY
jgi:hypothetical protein